MIVYKFFEKISTVKYHNKQKRKNFKAVDMQDEFIIVDIVQSKLINNLK